MTDALIFDAIRTPRGKGKKDGALHAVKPVDLLAATLHALQQRHRFDTGEVDDVVMGCVTPIGDQGGCIAKTAALKARLGLERERRELRFGLVTLCAGGGMGIATLVERV